MRYLQEGDKDVSGLLVYLWGESSTQVGFIIVLLFSGKIAFNKRGSFTYAKLPTKVVDNNCHIFCF